VHAARTSAGVSTGLGPFDLDAEELLELLELGAELAVELVAADARQVVATGLEERVAEVGASRFDGRRLTRPSTLVDLEQRLVLGRRDLLVLLPLALEEVEVPNEALEEARVVLLVVAEGPQDREHRQATLASDPRAGRDVLARLLLEVDLEPLAAIGVDGADDTLGAVDHEGALVGHHREVPHEDRLLFDLAGGGVHEAGPDEDRRREGHVLLLALLDGELRRWPQVLVVGVELQLELQGLREVLDRADVAEGVGQALVEEPVERQALDGDEIWEVENLVEVREGIAVPSTGGRSQGHSSMTSRSVRRIRAGARRVAEGNPTKARRCTAESRLGATAQALQPRK
jgi:hypothetical protein